MPGMSSNFITYKLHLSLGLKSAHANPTTKQNMCGGLHIQISVVQRCCHISLTMLWAILLRISDKIIIPSNPASLVQKRTHTIFIIKRQAINDTLHFHNTYSWPNSPLPQQYFKWNCSTFDIGNLMNFVSQKSVNML
jgi:ABC-type dipeptide/oligopeptide/nickel transport system permease component